MYAMIANKVTGESLSYHSSSLYSDADGIKCLRGHIRKWMKEGLQLDDFDIIEWSSWSVHSHLREYAWQKTLGNKVVKDNIVVGLNVYKPVK